MSFFGESSHLSIGLDRLEEHLIRVVRSPSLTWIASNNMVHLFDSWIRSSPGGKETTPCPNKLQSYPSRRTSNPVRFEISSISG